MKGGAMEASFSINDPSLRRWAAAAAFVYAGLSLITCFVMPTTDPPPFGAGGANVRVFYRHEAESVVAAALLSGLQFAPLLFHTESLGLLFRDRAHGLPVGLLRWSGRGSAFLAIVASAVTIGIVRGQEALSDAALSTANSIDASLWAALLVPFGVTALATTAIGASTRRLGRVTTFSALAIGVASIGGAPFMFAKSGPPLVTGLAVFVHPIWAGALGVSLIRRSQLDVVVRSTSALNGERPSTPPARATVAQGADVPRSVQ
jgi:hypothetical protein